MVICRQSANSFYGIFLFAVRLVLSLFAEKEGKAVHLSYEDKLKLVAYTCQVSHGKFNPDTLTPLGVLDVIGRDRRYVCVTFMMCLIVPLLKSCFVRKCEYN
jgi:hypothetical protein